MTDALGWVATGIMVIGSIDIAHKRIRGLWLTALGNVGWGFVGALSDLYSLIGVSFVMLALDLYAIQKWSEVCDGQDFPSPKSDRPE